MLAVLTVALGLSEAARAERRAPPTRTSTVAATLRSMGSISLSGPTVEGSATYRLLAVGQSDLVVDPTGTELGLNGWLEQRLRLGAIIRRQRVAVRFGADLFSGQLAGDTTNVGARYVAVPYDEIDAYRSFELRWAMVAVRTPYGELRVGHQLSHWGYGILTNSGQQQLAYGNQRLGDLVERAAFFTRPLTDFYVGLGSDLVYRDSNAELLQGDIGVNVFGTAFYAGRWGFAGTYVAHRSQWDRDDARLEVTAVDIHARSGGALGGGISWDAGLEGMLLAGTTSRSLPEPQLVNATVTSGGLVVRGQLAHRPTGIRFTAEAGVASGDGNLDDGGVHQATFHPDYRVGLILFSQVLGAASARSADRLADARHYAQMPRETRSLPTNGGVTNAVYIWPRLSIEPLAGLDLGVGLLYAWTVAGLIDPYTTENDAGGYNRNYLGGPANANQLGLEVQLRAGYRIELIDNLILALNLQYGRLFFGAAFANARGRTPPDIDRVVGRMTLGWRIR